MFFYIVSEVWVFRRTVTCYSANKRSFRRPEGVVRGLDLGHWAKICVQELTSVVSRGIQRLPTTTHYHHHLPQPTTATHPATLPDAATATFWLLQRSCKPAHAPATPPDSETTAFWLLQRSYNAPGRCNCCFLASATLLQRFQTLQLLLPGFCYAPATLPGAATACNCCY